MSAIAETSAGKVEGTEENGLRVFRGIPYAAPPVGDLRFRPPQPVEAWEGVRAAAKFSPIAPQVSNPVLDDLLPPPDPPQPQSEDCLYLNVWTPGLDGARPVMVWIHGGAFTIGSGSEAYYDGANLASRGDVVIVTINYRLGAFGFVNLPALGETNFGMRDQIAALRWVRENIANFGGDPDNVTIFGESAGGMSVATLMASSEAAGLFQRAIPQSGAGHHTMALADAETVGAAFLERLGVSPDDVDALRALPVETILERQGEMEAEMFAAIAEGGTAELRFTPVVDGEFLTARAIDAIAAGQSRGVQTLVGYLDEEWKLFTAMIPGDPPNEEDVVARLEAMGLDGRSAYDAYRAARLGRSEPAEPADIGDAAAGDQLFAIPALRLADAQSAQERGTFMYLFDWKSPALGGALGSCHALDIPFVFGTYEDAAEFAGSGPEAAALSERVMDAWLAFARSGDPSTSRRGFRPMTRRGARSWSSATTFALNTIGGPRSGRSGRGCCSRLPEATRHTP